MDGVGSRVLELYGRPIADEAAARELHQISERHYGHAGKRYIEYLTEEILSEEDKLEELYREMQKRLREAYGGQHVGEPGVHFDNISVLCLGDCLSSMSVFGLNEAEAWAQAVKMGMELLENNAQLLPEDSIQRAWDFTVDWIGVNRSHFCTSIYGGVMRYGSIAPGHVNINPERISKGAGGGGIQLCEVGSGLCQPGMVRQLHGRRWQAAQPVPV